MATTPRPSALVTRDTHSRGNNYRAMVLQVGVPVYDSDVNELQEIVQSQRDSFARSQAVGRRGMAGFDFGFTVLDSNAEATRNVANFGIVRGVVHTRLGVIDTRDGSIEYGAGLSPVIPFDQALLGEASLEGDGLFENYILRGTATGGSTTSLVDEDKFFQEHHALLGMSFSSTVAAAGDNAVGDESTTASAQTWTFNEGACRVFFLTGANAGTIATITSYTGNSISFSALANAVSAGDVYTILPANGVQEYATAFNATTAGTEPPLLFAYLWAVEEDISPSEDPNLEHPLSLGRDVSHRTQLRWCVRVARMRATVEGTPVVPYGYASALASFVSRDNSIAPMLNDGRGDARLAVSLPANSGEIDFSTTSLAAHPLLAAGQGKGFGAVLRLVEGILAAYYQDFLAEAAPASDVVALWSVYPAPRVSGATLLTSMHPENAGASNEQPLLVNRPQTSPILISRATVFTQKEHAYYDAAQVSEQLVRSATLEKGEDTWGSGTLFDADGRELAYDNAAQRANAAHEMAAAALGVGQDFGRQRRSVAGNNPARLATSPLLATEGLTDDFLINAAGQATVYGLEFDAGDLRASAPPAAGTLSPIPLLTADADYSKPNALDEGVGVGYLRSTLGSYFLRDGTEITQDGELGWSFWKPDTVVNGETVRSQRGLDEGILMAARVQESLLWRQLAIKSTAHEQGDLFTYRIDDPQETYDRIYTEGLTKAQRHGMSALGALQTLAGKEEGYNSLSWETRESYTLGGMTLGDAEGTPFVALDTFSTSRDATAGGVGVVYNPASHPRDPAQRGGASVEWAEASSANPPPFEDATVHPDAFTGGPWGRGKLPLASASADAPRATLDERLTTLRLRYHVGDYYPNENGGNALVTSMMLFVRLGQLSLVHWATMPKHQHPVLASSISSYVGVMSSLAGVSITGSDSHLLAEDGRVIHQEESPAIDGVEPGDLEQTSLPFAHANQLFVHWYHPMQEYITSPHPGGIDYNSGVTRKKIYSKFGERSLIIPGATVAESLDANASVGGADNWEVTKEARADFLGGHYNLNTPNILPTTPGQAEDLTITLSDLTTVAVKSTGLYFPFNPLDIDRSPAGWTAQLEGVPGPLFMPVGRQYAVSENWDTEGRDFGFHPVFNAVDSNLEQEWGYFPAIDHNRGRLTAWQEPEATLSGSAWRWNMPVLRAAIRTDTLAAIVRAVRANATLTPSEGTVSEPTPWSGPDRTTDTAYLGSLGTSISRAAGEYGVYGGGERVPLRRFVSDLYLNPLGMGGRWDTETGQLLPLGSHKGTPVEDAFQLAFLERQAAAVTEAAAFNPLISTMAAIRFMGMQQKLLWNCSFRVLHARPSGGADRKADGSYERRAGSTAPKSLTELFLVRNRQTGQPVEWPKGPVDKNAKPYIHLESMHPTAAGGVVVEGVTLQAHPNHAYIGHLYPMVCDSMGAAFNSPGSVEDLWSDTADNVTDTPVTKELFVNPAVYTGLTGDTYAADPFDYECAKALVPEQRVAKRDRMADNSGIEIDILNELREVRANAATYGLDQVGFGGKTWLDMMPTPEDLTDPGDHEILFVLYTGAAGQKMIDSTVPEHYNPPYAGCHVTATLEINRPTERMSSGEDLAGKHYGRSKRTSHVLGAS